MTIAIWQIPLASKFAVWQFMSMKLAAYLKVNRLTANQLAKRMGRPTSTITRLLKGQRNASLGLLDAIRKATDGSVMPNDFLLDAPIEPCASPQPADAAPDHVLP
jgi:transcriptional regulator with XRE-family HTH domain